jgi:hypothetical protein
LTSAEVLQKFPEVQKFWKRQKCFLQNFWAASSSENFWDILKKHQRWNSFFDFWTSADFCRSENLFWKESIGTRQLAETSK